MGTPLMQQVSTVLKDLAPGGAWPGRNTRQPPTYPFITFFRVVRSNNISFDGPSDLQPSRIQIDVVALRYSDGEGIAKQVRDAMVAHFKVGSIDEQEFPQDPDVDAFRFSADFNVWSVD